jgi:hypothetical protein
MKRGTQELILLSDEVEINGNPYYKTFSILNSSDKSRKLNMNLGLYRSDKQIFFSTGVNNMSFCKKHLTGVTKAAEDSSFSLNGETFDDQINSIKSLVGESVMLSKIQDIIVGKGQKVDHNKFDAFKNQLFYYNQAKLTKGDLTFLRTPSDKMLINSTNDFSVDAYSVFNIYMQVFRNQDSYVVKKESEKIIKITQCFIRNEKLNQLLDLEELEIS